MARLFGFGLGFLGALGMTAAAMSLDSSGWLVPLLLAATGAFLGLLPHFRAPESRMAPMCLYAAMFSAGWMWSIQVPGRNQDTPVARGILLILGLLFVYGLVLLIRTPDAIRRNGWLWLMFALGTGVAAFSGPSGASGGRWEDWLIARLSIDPATAEALVFAFRKGVHFGFYGVLAVVAYRAAFPAPKAVAFAFGIATVHAIFDEGRQSFVGIRSGQAVDVAIDLAGAAVFLLIASRLLPKGASPESPRP